MNKYGHVKNPLTVIAIFAAITESVTAAALPFLSDANQFIFIWFVMFFPVFLVSLFFLTLLFKREVLYAPSDFVDQTNFFRNIKKMQPEKVDNKYEMEANIVEPVVANAEFTIEPTEFWAEEKTTPRKLSRVKAVKEIERFLLNNIEAENNIIFEKNVTVANGYKGIDIDAYAEFETNIYIAEVMFLSEPQNVNQLVIRLINEINIAVNFIKEKSKKRVLVYIRLVVNDESLKIQDVLQDTMRAVNTINYNYDLNYNVYQYSTLLLQVQEQGT